MKIEILGCESFGARSLACTVITGKKKILIDPGVALARLRYGLPPHPVEIAAALKIRKKILYAFEGATDVVISHYHGDHMPMKAEDPYQLPVEALPPLKDIRFWSKGPEKISGLSARRRKEFSHFLDSSLPSSEGSSFDCISFSYPVPHGTRDKGFGTVMMTRVCEGDDVFVHSSDIQLLDRETVLEVLAWKPTVVFSSGPPLYLSHHVPEASEEAFENALLLARNVETLILDHHLLRSLEGYMWLKKLAGKVENTVLCAAEFMGKEPELLEARRKMLYEKLPVPRGWHEAYAKGEGGLEEYL
ncbi:MBL fold metallo-hydrolase [Methanosarcina sp. T3]|uniref:MBL fold metallo-hydrolase n=1 Tax=Methanosarcina sp. T3 TaxID=3439062 RepID=UPI003F87B4BC